MRNYFTKNCSNHDKNFRSTVSPFITDKKTHGNRNILLTNKDETDPKCKSELFNDYFSSVANGIGFDGDVESAKDAIMKHRTPPSISKIEQNRHNGKTFEFQKVNEVDVKRKVKNINIRKATGFDNIPRKILRIASLELSSPNLPQWRAYLIFLSLLAVFLT